MSLAGMWKLRYQPFACGNDRGCSIFQIRPWSNASIGQIGLLRYDSFQSSCLAYSGNGETMRRFRLLVLVLCLPVTFSPNLHSADQNTKPPDRKSRYETRKVHDPEGIGKFYMEREIAQVMG